MMNAQELLERNGIRLNSHAPGRHYTTCPKCSGNRSRAHQGNKVLGVTIDDDIRARWGCNHCGWTGPKSNGNGRDTSSAGHTTYDYQDADGTVRFQKVRSYDSNGEKFFWLRRPDGNGGWIKGAAGVNTKIIYRLPEVKEAIALGRTILVVEGEKDSDNCWRLGIPATCNAQGASEPGKAPKWHRKHSEQLRGADIVVIPDHDPAGYAHADATCHMSLGIAKRARILKLAEHWPDCPKGGDVSDWLAAGNTREQLDALIEQAPDYPGPNDAAPPKPGDTPIWQNFGQVISVDEQKGLVIRFDRKLKPDLLERLGLEPRNNDRNALQTIAANEVEMCGVEWLWPDRFALGKIGLIAGLPDMGKGQIAAFVAAAVTARVDLPCSEGRAIRGNVIWFNAEDDARDTVKPRLVAAGADLKHVHFVSGARAGGKDKTFSLVTDLSLLREAISRIGNVVLIIIDPVSAHLGVGKVDGRSATDVRGVLTPLKDMAEELHVAVIGIAHFNKKDDVKSALLRVSDSIAWVAAARHVYAVLDDPEDKNSKLFVKAKNNLARDTKALRYGIGVRKVGHDARLGKDIDAPFIVWHSQHVDITANEAMQAGGGSAGARREAEEFLRNRLATGPAKQADVVEEAEQDGISLVTLRRAKKKLCVKSSKEKGKTDGDWFWELPKVITHPRQREK